MIIYLKRLWEIFKAWRRGEVMSKTISRGRCFSKKGTPTLEVLDKPSLGKVSIKPKATMKLVGIKVIRADGTEEDIKHG